MKTYDVENQLMDYVREFTARDYKTDSSGYAEQFIGFKDDVLWVYGHKDKVEDLNIYNGVKKLIVTKLNQEMFNKVIEYYKDSIEQIFLWKSPLINDFSKLSEITNLEYFVGLWNNKARKLWKMESNLKLKGVSLSSFSKVDSLGDFKNSTIEELDFSGNRATLEKVSLKNMNSLRTIPNLKSLTMSGVKFPEDAVKQLAKLKNLEELNLDSNSFQTEEYAYLSVKLPKVKGNNLGPYWELRNNEVIIVGKRKPILNKEKDSTRIEKYVEQYNKFIEKIQNSL